MALHNDEDKSVEGVFRQYGRKLRRFIESRARKTHSADDLAQEVYLRLLRFPPTDVVRQPRAYLYRIASNVVHDFNLRTQQEPIACAPEVLNELSEHAGDVWQNDPADRLGAEQELDRLLDRLPPLQQAVLLMLKRDGLSHGQIARELGISPFTVRKYIGLAYAQLRRMAP